MTDEEDVTVDVGLHVADFVDLFTLAISVCEWHKENASFFALLLHKILETLGDFRCYSDGLGKPLQMQNRFSNRAINCLMFEKIIIAFPSLPPSLAGKFGASVVDFAPMSSSMIPAPRNPVEVPEIP